MEVIGHAHRKPPSDIARAAVEWNPQGTRKRERPRTTWRWTVLNELKPDKKSWDELEALAANRTTWRTFTLALCSTEELKELMMMMMMNGEVWRSL
jgi:hypothetical protein